MKKLSIIIPVYNQSAFTAQCIRNLYDVCGNIDFEVLIIDDGSQDNTQQVVKALRSNKIKYYKFKQNVWVTKAWNTGVEYATWKYIVVINNDVIFKPWCFEKLMDWLEDPKHKVIMTWPRFCDGMKPFERSPIYYGHNINWHCYMFKKAMKKKLFPIDERMRIFYNDIRLYYHLKDQWYNVKVVKDAICHHFTSQTSFFVENKDAPNYRNIAKERKRNTNPTIEILHDVPKTDLLF